MKMSRWIVVVALLATVTGTAVAQDPVQVAPDQYKQIFDNGRTRVLEVSYKKGATSAMHSHPDHVAYMLSGGTLEFTMADGTKKTISAKAGETIFAPAQAHSIKNVGNSNVRVIVTELKEVAPTGALSAAERAEILELYEQGQEELRELVASTTDEEWAKKPAPDRWSVSEVVEHLGAAESLIFGMAQKALASPEDPNWALTEGGLSPENFVGMLKDRSKKFQAPEPLQPKGGMSRADALAKYAGARAVTADFVTRTVLPVKKHLADGPAGKMTAHQVLVLIGGHNLRHNQQIRETLEAIRK